MSNNQTEPDNRVAIPIDLPDEELLELFKQAHYRDMTFNAFVEEILKNAIDLWGDKEVK
jgi:predicted HTH domain antitoxin